MARPQDDDGLVFLGEAYLNSNEPDKAIGAFEQALRVNPNSEDAKQALEELRSRLAPAERNSRSIKLDRGRESICSDES